MTIDDAEYPVDLSPLGTDAERRSGRVTAAVLARVASARAEAVRRRALRDEVQRRLARFALPVSMAAAASMAAIALTGRPPAARPETFAIVVLGRGPATRWIVLDRMPEIPELMAVVGSAP